MRTLAAVFLCAFAAPGWASSFSSSANGTTSAEFLQLGVGARALTMGQAYTAVADDATAVYWNPAGMTQIQKRSATVMHTAYIASSFFDYGAYAQNLGKYGTVGMGYQYFSAGSITQTDASATSIGTFSPYDFAATLAYAYALGDSAPALLNGYSLGVGLKFINASIVSSAQSEALDAGVLSRPYLDGKLRLAFDMSNMGPALKFDQVSESLPMTFKAGSSYKIRPNWLASLDVVMPRGGGPTLGMGTEYQVVTSGPWRFAGRAGFNSATISDISGFSGVSFGVGFGYRGASLDYGFVPFGGLGQAQIVSLSYNF